MLPEYQGLGIGRILCDEIAKHYSSYGKRYRETTSHPARIFSHKKNSNWRCVSIGRQGKRPDTKKKLGASSNNRLVTSWEFKNEKNR